MKRLLFIVAALILTTSASAEGIYGGFARDNPNLQNITPEQPMMSAEAKASDEIRVYHGLARQNPDLVGKRESSGPTGENPDIFEGFEPNPDLSY